MLAGVLYFYRYEGKACAFVTQIRQSEIIIGCYHGSPDPTAGAINTSDENTLSLLELLVGFPVRFGYRLGT